MYFKTLNTFALRFLNERRISTERRKLLSRLTAYLCHRFSRQNKVVVFFRPHYWLFWRHFYKRISNRWRFTVVQALVSKKYCVGRGHFKTEQSTSKERRKLYFNSSNVNISNALNFKPHSMYNYQAHKFAKLPWNCFEEELHSFLIL